MGEQALLSFRPSQRFLGRTSSSSEPMIETRRIGKRVFDIAAELQIFITPLHIDLDRVGVLGSLHDESEAGRSVFAHQVADDAIGF